MNNFFLVNRNQVRNIDKVILFFVMIEILLGGNGYLTQVNGIRVRVILFGICMLWALSRLLVLYPVRLPKPVLWMLFSSVMLTAFSALNGYVAGARLGAIVADVKPLSYFPMIIFFFVVIRDRQDVVMVARLVMICGSILSAIYFVGLALAYTGVVEYRDIYLFLKQSDEFIFRHNPDAERFVGFLYKGFFHLSPAILLLFFARKRWAKYAAIALSMILAMALTRGFMISLIAGLAVAFLVERNLSRLSYMVSAAVLSTGVLLWAVSAERDMLRPSAELVEGDIRAGKGEEIAEIIFRPTDSIRMNDVRFVLEHVDLTMFALGRGLGSKIADREKIETTYLEIFYKQGILGLTLWLSILLYAAYLLPRALGSDRNLATAFFSIIIFVYSVTTFNTFLTGSIGMAVVWYSAAALYVLAEPSLEPRARAHPF